MQYLSILLHNTFQGSLIFHTYPIDMWYSKCMILLIHIIVALSSIIASTASFLRPSKAKLRLTYGLTLLTLATGTYLVWSTHSPLLSSCITGLLYLGVVLSGVLAAWRKLAHEQAGVKE